MAPSTRRLTGSLFQAQAPKVFIGIVLLLSWNSEVAFDRGYSLVEIFSGQGCVSQKWHSLGHQVASLDYTYSERNMDFLSVSGFVLSLYSLLNLAPRGLALFAPDCSSWGIPCRFTSGRSYINPLGHENLYRFVAGANLMVSRMTLCLQLIVSMSCFFLVEQPSQSLLFRHTRFEWFCNRVAWVYFTRFWMLHHGAPSSKRTVFWGNLRSMSLLDKGRLSHTERDSKTSVKTTRKYMGKDGSKRFVGQKEALKSTQAYPEQLGESIHEVYMEELRLPPRGDLRITRTLESGKAPHEWFSDMPLGDTWSDADLFPVFEYLYKCRHTRIPDEWAPVMRDLYKEWAEIQKS